MHFLFSFNLQSLSFSPSHHVSLKRAGVCFFFFFAALLDVQFAPGEAVCLLIGCCCSCCCFSCAKCPDHKSRTLQSKLEGWKKKKKKKGIFFLFIYFCSNPQSFQYLLLLLLVWAALILFKVFGVTLKWRGPSQAEMHKWIYTNVQGNLKLLLLKTWNASKSDHHFIID